MSLVFPEAHPGSEVPQAITCHLQGDISTAPRCWQARVVHPTDIANSMLLGSDWGQLQVPRLADRAVRMMADSREPRLPLSLSRTSSWATSELPLDLQTLRREEVGCKTEQFWGCLSWGSPHNGCWC